MSIEPMLGPVDYLLQRGRAFEGAEMERIRCVALPRDGASTGPRF